MARAASGLISPGKVAAWGHPRAGRPGRLSLLAPHLLNQIGHSITSIIVLFSVYH